MPRRKAPLLRWTEEADERRVRRQALFEEQEHLWPLGFVPVGQYPSFVSRIKARVRARLAAPAPQEKTWRAC